MRAPNSMETTERPRRPIFAPEPPARRESEATPVKVKVKKVVVRDREPRASVPLRFGFPSQPQEAR